MASDVVVPYLSEADVAQLNKIETALALRPVLNTLPLDDRLVYVSSLRDPKRKQAIDVSQEPIGYNPAAPPSLQKDEDARKLWVLMNANRVRILSAAMQMPRVFHLALPYHTSTTTYGQSMQDAVETMLDYLAQRSIDLFSQCDKVLVTFNMPLTASDSMPEYLLLLEVNIDRASSVGLLLSSRVYTVRSDAYESLPEETRKIIALNVKSVYQYLLLAVQQKQQSDWSLVPGVFGDQKETFVDAGIKGITVRSGKDDMQALFFKLIQLAGEISGLSSIDMAMLAEVDTTQLNREVGLSLRARQIIQTDGSQRFAAYPTTPAQALLNPLSAPRVLPDSLLEVYQQAQSTVTQAAPPAAKPKKGSRRAVTATTAVTVVRPVMPPVDEKVNAIFRFFALRLIGAAHPFGGEASDIADKLLDVRAAAIVGRFDAPFNVRESKFDTIADLLRVNVALWPYMCPLVDYRAVSLEKTFVAYWTGYYEAEYSNINTRIVKGAKALFEKIVLQHKLVVPDQAKRFFTAALEYLHYCDGIYKKLKHNKQAKINVSDNIGASTLLERSSVMEQQYRKVIACLSSVLSDSSIVREADETPQYVQWKLRRTITTKPAGPPYDETTRPAQYFVECLAWLQDSSNPAVIENASKWKEFAERLAKESLLKERKNASFSPAAKAHGTRVPPAVVVPTTFNHRPLLLYVPKDGKMLPVELAQFRRALCQQVPPNVGASEARPYEAYDSLLSVANLQCDDITLPPVIARPKGTTTAAPLTLLTMVQQQQQVNSVGVLYNDQRTFVKAVSDPHQRAFFMTYGSPNTATASDSTRRHDALLHALKLKHPLSELFRVPNQLYKKAIVEAAYVDYSRRGFYEITATATLCYYLLAFMKKQGLDQTEFKLLFGPATTTVPASDAFTNYLSTIKSRLVPLIETRPRFNVAELAAAAHIEAGAVIGEGSGDYNKTPQLKFSTSDWALAMLDIERNKESPAQKAYAETIVALYRQLLNSDSVLTASPAAAAASSPVVTTRIVEGSFLSLINAISSSSNSRQRSKSKTETSETPFESVANDNTDEVVQLATSILTYARELHELFTPLAKSDNYGLIAKYEPRLHLNRLYTGLVYLAQVVRYALEGNSRLVNIGGEAPALAPPSTQRIQLAKPIAYASGSHVFGTPKIVADVATPKGFHSVFDDNGWHLYDSSAGLDQTLMYNNDALLANLHNWMKHLVIEEDGTQQSSDIGYPVLLAGRRADEDLMWAAANRAESLGGALADNSIDTRIRNVWSQSLVAALRARDGFALNTVEQRAKLDVLLSTRVVEILRDRKERGLSLTGLECDLVVCNALRQLLAQRIMLFESQLEAADAVSVQTDTDQQPSALLSNGLRTYRSSAYFMIGDAPNNRLFWTGAGDSSPILVSFEVPQAASRANTYAQFATVVSTMKFQSKSESEKLVLTTLLSKLESQRVQDANVRSFIEAGNLDLQRKSLREQIAALERSVANYTQMLAEMRGKEHLRAEIDELALKQKHEVERLLKKRSILMLLDYLELGSGLNNESNNFYLLQSVIEQAPQFCELRLMWHALLSELQLAMSAVLPRYDANYPRFRAVYDAITRIVDKRTNVERATVARAEYFKLTKRAMPEFDSTADNFELNVIEQFTQLRIDTVDSATARTIEEILSEPLASVHHLHLQVEFYRHRLSAEETLILDSAIAFLKSPLTVKGGDYPALKAVLNVIEERKTLAKTALRRYVESQKYPSGKLVLLRGDFDEARVRALPASVRESSHDDTMETLTKLLLEHLAGETNTKDLYTLTPRAAGGVHFTATDINSDEARELLQRYRNTPHEYMTDYKNVLRVAEFLPTNKDIVDYARIGALPVRENLCNSLLRAIDDKEIYLNELPVENLKSLVNNLASNNRLNGIDVQTFQNVLSNLSKQAARYDFTTMVKVNSTHLDQSTQNIADEYRPWYQQTHNNGALVPPYWPLFDMFRYGRAMTKRETGDQVLDEISKRVFSERRLRTIGNLYLKSSAYAVPRQVLVKALGAEGVPVSQAHAQADVYESVCATPLQMPVVEASPAKSVRSGVVHLDNNMVCLVAGSERFHQALAREPLLVNNVVEQHARAYYDAARHAAFVEALAFVRGHVKDDLQMWLDRTDNQPLPALGRPLNIAREMSRKAFDRFTLHIVSTFFPFEAKANVSTLIEAHVKRVFNKNMYTLEDVLAALEEIDAILRSEYSHTSKDSINLREAIQRDLQAAAIETLVSVAGKVAYEQVAPESTLDGAQLLGLRNIAPLRKRIMDEVNVVVVLFSNNIDLRGTTTRLAKHISDALYALFDIFLQEASRPAAAAEAAPTEEERPLHIPSNSIMSNVCDSLNAYLSEHIYKTDVNSSA